MTISNHNNPSGDRQLNFSEPRARSEIRPVSFENHPVCLHTYSCSTMQLEDLAVRVVGWINAGVPEAVICAPAGIGKTYAIQHASQRLSGQFPDVGHVKIHAASIPADAHGQALSFLKKHVLELVGQTGKRSVVLWIDESQTLEPAAENSLRGLRDALIANNIRSTTVLVGHLRLGVLNQKWFSFVGDAPTFVPRVSVEEFRLQGLRSVTEVEHCLRFFDIERFPSDSDWCYTRFFLPQAYLNGLRLETQAGELWDVFEEHDRDRGPETVTELPMMYFARTVERALIASAAMDRADFRFDRELWKWAVQQSGWGERLTLDLPVREMYGAGAIC